MSAETMAAVAASVRERQTTNANAADRPLSRLRASLDAWTPDASLPVDSLKEAASYLRRPFTDRAVKFKVQSDWNGGAMIVAYIDARLVVERLNLVCPHLWRDAYEPAETRMLCHLTVDEITRSDVGDGYKGKGLYSDALKRAAVKFGVGVSLYAIPRIYLDKGPLLHQKVVKEKLRTRLTDVGEKHCRDAYREWLKTEGISAFGAPLDHGDAENSVGDPEVHAEPPETETSAQRDPNAITKKRAEELVGRAIGVELKSERLSMWLTSQGVDHEPFTTKAGAVEVIRGLTPVLADKLDTFISDSADGAP